MKRYQITLDGRTYEIQVLGDPQQEQVEVEVNGKRLMVEFNAMPVTGGADEALPALTSAEPPGAVAAFTAEPVAVSGKVVTAPLPGVIKYIAVHPGQQVAIGDELLVIEAMKMDNVIRASRDGVIATIHVPEGRQVAHGEHLLEYVE